MLTHKIALYTKPAAVVTPDERFKGEHGSEEHKQYIHLRVLNKCKYDVGDNVKYQSRPGVIVGIADQECFELVEWNGLECKCIEVFLYDKGESIMVHPSTLKRRN